MNNSIDQQLADLFSSIDAKEEKTRKAKTAREEKEASFVAEFVAARTKVISTCV